MLAQRGFGSRRRAEELIRDGKVLVNGSVAALGTAVGASDLVLVEGRPLPRSPEPVYVVLHKPPGVIVTRRDPAGRRTVMDLLDPRLGPSVFPVGRLDLPSEGLLLLTNDGDLANRLLHPRYGLIRTYLVWVGGGPIGDRQLEAARQGVEIEPGLTVVPRAVRVLGSWPGGGQLEVSLGEGRKREVRRICEALGWRVLRLKRIAFGPLRLGDLPPGHSRRLTPAELSALRRAVQA